MATKSSRQDPMKGTGPATEFDNCGGRDRKSDRDLLQENGPGNYK